MLHRIAVYDALTWKLTEMKVIISTQCIICMIAILIRRNGSRTFPVRIQRWVFIFWHGKHPYYKVANKIPYKSANVLFFCKSTAGDLTRRLIQDLHPANHTHTLQSMATNGTTLVHKCMIITLHPCSNPFNEITFHVIAKMYTVGGDCNYVLMVWIFPWLIIVAQEERKRKIPVF